MKYWLPPFEREIRDSDNAGKEIKPEEFLREKTKGLVRNQELHRRQCLSMRCYSSDVGTATWEHSVSQGAGGAMGTCLLRPHVLSWFYSCRIFGYCISGPRLSSQVWWIFILSGFFSAVSQKKLLFKLQLPRCPALSAPSHLWCVQRVCLQMDLLLDTG